jgi:hypothetical protein
MGKACGSILDLINDAEMGQFGFSSNPPKKIYLTEICPI